jgi:hypothetical protein
MNGTARLLSVTTAITFRLSNMRSLEVQDITIEPVTIFL